MTTKHFDTIVIGGGHAGTEAAAAAARSGANTLLLTHNIATIGQMSCNPAIGGIGKGHLVKEIDAMGGLMARATDRAGIQFRILNASKGPAVRATRAQADRVLYKQAILNMLENQANLLILQQEVIDLLVTGMAVYGVLTQSGEKFFAPTVVLCTGTFLGGKIHIGLENHAGGRADEPPSIALASRLRELPFKVGRLKTGTPCRIDGQSIDYATLQMQAGDIPAPVFSFMGSRTEHPRQVNCYITHTNEKTHAIIRANLHRSPLYNGVIESLGPRYCPSIEDKVVRFADKKSHQIFIEPEGLNTYEIYPNGVSTSLPVDVQADFIHSIKGFENARITRFGYAIEYDYFDPRDLKSSLETKFIQGLFFAGQINGTTGYEEAAAQGLLAGVNAARQARGLAAWSPQRHQAYLGVMIDDLITSGTNEPYRMFTSRAEYRLLLREDNADLRLTAIGYELGLVDAPRWAAFTQKQAAVDAAMQRITHAWVSPQMDLSQRLNAILAAPLTKDVRLLDILRRPGVSYAGLQTAVPEYLEVIPLVIAEQVEVQAKYDGYIQQQQVEIARQAHYENTLIPILIDYTEMASLSHEVRQKLTQTRPQTIGLAARIPGVTPAAISILLVHLKKQNLLKQAQSAL